MSSKDAGFVEKISKINGQSYEYYIAIFKYFLKFYNKR